MTQEEFAKKYSGDKSFQNEVDKNPMAAMGKYEVELADEDLEEVAGGFFNAFKKKLFMKSNLGDAANVKGHGHAGGAFDKSQPGPGGANHISGRGKA
jgi:hypothetical protein